MDEVTSGASATSTTTGAASLNYATMYASERPRHGARVWAGLAILLGGLGLIVLGGCFMIGILALVTNGGGLGFSGSATAAPPISPAGTSLMLVLYVLAFGCFAGAIAVIIAGVRGLVAVMKA